MSATGVDADRLVITAWAAVSPYGVGRSAFVEGLREQRPTDTEVRAPQWDVPDDRACLVPGFDIREMLGKKGTRAMDRGTALALSAVGALLTELGPDGGVRGRDDTALVLGTSFGSTQTMMDFTRASLTEEKPFYVDPAMMPYAVMNAAAGQCAIWYELRGPNTTMAGGRGSALLGLRYARRLLANGRAARALVGATEDYSRSRSWLWRQAAPETPVVLGEGALMMLVEPVGAVGADRRPLAEVLVVESRIFFDADPRAELAACILAALKAAGLAAADVDLVALSDAPGPLGGHERQVVAETLGDEVTVLPSVSGLLGETACVSGAFQIGSVLATAHTAGGLGGRVALVTSVDRDGTVACALLRLCDAS
ncbi:beta-ketoacyl synthase N-terminal-like domain-containing protein [Micromonospora sp. NBC_01796]|uniref:beta-ketoacyl synthase N-terminal-like domain-containing protein n=1 Tax=Micromonospora sp. NBC_01796 TaxID=2975987 RepID=UPI002DD85E4E|nr:beta-ketoacyl synthase N-terminal-like domain-containing protein [Micromonospora sp. NBC_01796]WSA85942.1 hypothetical protein OIE47_37315 [Micromonospora sp. NBC_01796]